MSQGEAQVYNAAAEIGTGFMLIIQLLTPARSILLTFVYWYVIAYFSLSGELRIIVAQQANVTNWICPGSTVCRSFGS